MTGTFDNRKARSNNPRTASRKLSHVRRARASRHVLPGFPIETPFEEPQDVWDYLNGSVITCLRCGKSYKGLMTHLRVHGWTANQYKEFYGLPWGTGLTSEGTKAIQRANGIRLTEAGVTFGGILNNPEAIKKAHAAKHRKRAAYRKGVGVMNINKTRTHDVKRVASGEFLIYQGKHYWEVLARMKAQDCTMAEVCKEHGQPGQTGTLKYARENKDFRLALDEAWEELSFPTQAKGEHLGKRFLKEAGKLRSEGLTCKEIGELLGVHAVTTEIHLLAGKVPVPEKTHCQRGHLYPPRKDGKKKCGICAIEARRRLQGALPRAEAAKAQITVPCSGCGALVMRSRLWGYKRGATCKACLKEYHRQYEIRRKAKPKIKVTLSDLGLD